MNAADALTIHTTWRKEGDLFLYATDSFGMRVAPIRLKTVLFAWHRASLYGSLTEQTRLGELEGLVLKARLALDYFNKPSPLEHAAIRWSPESEELLQLAPFLQRTLANGWYGPDHDAWSLQNTAWKLVIPDEEVPVGDAAMANRWLSSVINDLIAQEPDVQRTWARALQAYPCSGMLRPRLPGRNRSG